jgi:hypothetical protein
MVAAFVKVAASNQQTTASTSITATVAAGGVAVGHTLVVGLNGNGVGTVVSATDTRGNTYTIDRTSTATTGGQVLHTTVTTALLAGDTITVTGDTSISDRSMIAAEFSGVDDFDQVVSGSGTGTAVNSGATPATTQADELVVAFVGISSSTGTLTATDASYTQIGSAGVGLSRQTFMFYKTVAATGTQAITATLSASVGWRGTVATYAATPAPVAPAFEPTVFDAAAFDAQPPVTETGSGGGDAGVAVTATGEGVARDRFTGGSSVTMASTSTGEGVPAERPSGGAVATVTAAVVGAGTAREANTGGASSTVTTTPGGAGNPRETLSGGASTTVTTTPAGFLGVTTVGSTTGTTTPALPPGTTTGDVVVVYSFATTATAPTTPTGWSNVVSNAASPAFRCQYRVYDGVWTMPTFTNAVRTHAVTMRGQLATGPAVSLGTANVTAATISWGITTADASSVILHAAAHTNPGVLIPASTGAVKLQGEGTAPGYITQQRTDPTSTTLITSAVSTSAAFSRNTLEVRARAVALETLSGGSTVTVGTVATGEGTQAETQPTGGSVATVTATATGAGTGRETQSGGAAATVAAVPVGAGTPRERLTGGAATTVTVTPVGAGTPRERVTGGAVATVTTAPVGGGTSRETNTGGGTVTVVAATAGAGTARETRAGGGTVTVASSPVGSGTARERVSDGSTAIVHVTVTTPVPTDNYTGGGSSRVAPVAFGAGTATERTNGSGTAVVAAVSAGGGSSREQTTGGGSSTVTAATTGAGTARESGTGAGFISVESTPGGGGTAAETVADGSDAVVYVVAAGGGLEVLPFPRIRYPRGRITPNRVRAVVSARERATARVRPNTAGGRLTRVRAGGSIRPNRAGGILQPRGDEL